MLSLENINKCYGIDYVLEDLNLTIQSGTIYGFLGVNGAGKSTTLKIISGLLLPSSGTVKINGVDLHLEMGLKRKIGYVPDDVAVYEYLTGEEYIYFVGNLFSVPKRELTIKCAKLLHDFRLRDVAKKLIKTYSHGMKQKLIIAAALIHSPQILILDEPLTGVDLISSKIIREKLYRYVKKGNIVIFSTHILELAHAICTKIGIIDKGKVEVELDVAKYTLDEINKKVEAIYLQ